MHLPNIRFVALATAGLALVGQSQAFWRLQCEGIVGTARIDPLVSPKEASSHLHTIKGGSAFSPSSTANDLLKSNCTSCQVKQDHSAYWTASLYFQDSMGNLSPVPEISGHLTYYKYTPVFVNGVYTYPSAAPNGLQIISGDPYQRNFSGLPVPDPPLPWSGVDASQEALRQKAIGFNCMNYQAAPEASLYRHFLPEKSFIDANCPDGMRLELLFPQCWNGELDSEDHRSHLAFPDAGINGGACPKGFDKVINQLFFETIFDTAQFKGKDGSFVLSDGDPTGFGYHGDVIIAWDEGVLDAATQQCGPDASPSDIGHNGETEKCPVFQMNSVEDQRACKIELPPMLDSDVITGSVQNLPGKVAIVAGPGYAKPGGSDVGPVQKHDDPVPALSDTSTTTSSSVEGGNVFKVGAATSTSTSTSSSMYSMDAASSPPSSSSPPPAAADATPSMPAPPPPPPPAAMTPAPAPAAPANNADVAALEFSTITTSWYTKGQEAYEVIVVAEEVTVTVPAGGATPAPGAKAKRDFLHRHGRRHGHHGGRHQ